MRGVSERVKLCILIGATLVLGTLIYLHTPGIDGPWYAHYGWHRAHWRSHFPMMLASAAPLFAALVLHERQRWVVAPLMLTMISLAGFTVSTVTHLRDDLSAVPMLVLIKNPMRLSYFADAAALHDGSGSVRDWLAHYPQLMGQMYLHSQEKPPGPVLFFATFIRAFGVTDRAALFSGLVVGGIVTLGVPAMYAFARVMGADRSGAFYSAMVLTLMPSLSLFFPSLDAMYAGATCVLLALWAIATGRNRFVASAGFGAALALVLFFVYNVLVIGTLVLAYGFMLTPRGRRTMRLVRHALVALGTLGAIYLVLWLITGFNPIWAFQSALENQARMEADWWKRPYPWTVLFDLTDFALGAGYLALLLCGFYLLDRRERWALMLLGIGELLIVAATGLLRAETARVWTFLTPLVALPAGEELARWRRGPRLAAYVCMFIILALLSQNLTQKYGTMPPLAPKSPPRAVGAHSGF